MESGQVSLAQKMAFVDFVNGSPKYSVRSSGQTGRSIFKLSHPPFPGFEAAFRIPWKPDPTLELTIDDNELKSVYLNEKHQRVYKTVDTCRGAGRLHGAEGKLPRVGVSF